MPTSDLKREIMRLQDIQMANPPSSAAWQDASAKLQPLFAEMARRFPVPA